MPVYVVGKSISKSRKIVSHYILSFPVQVQMILIKIQSWIHILMANKVYIVIFTLYFQTWYFYLIDRLFPTLQSGDPFLSRIKQMK